jgi:hypothetical protein
MPSRSQMHEILRGRHYGQFVIRGSEPGPLRWRVQKARKACRLTYFGGPPLSIRPYGLAFDPRHRHGQILRRNLEHLHRLPARTEESQQHQE